MGWNLMDSDEVFQTLIYICFLNLVKCHGDWPLYFKNTIGKVLVIVYASQPILCIL